MIKRELKKLELVESEHSHDLRHRLITLSFILFALIVFAITLTYVIGPGLLGILSRLFGLAMILLGLWISAFMFEAFARSSARDISPARRALLLMLLKVKEYDDIVSTFCESEAGRFALSRLEIEENTLDLYLKMRLENSDKLTLSEIEDHGDVKTEDDLDILDIVPLLVKHDSSFATFLNKAEIGEGALLASTRWYVERAVQKNEMEEWWRRGNLLSLPSLGRAWAYGGTYMLDRYARDLTEEAKDSYTQTSLPREEEIERLFSTLSRAHERNVLVVGGEGGGADALLSATANILVHGTLSKLRGLRLLSLDGASLLSATKGSSEDKLVTLLNEAVKAGNVILAFHDFGSFLGVARKAGIDLPALLDPYLESALPTIAVVDSNSYHEWIEPNPELGKRFEKLSIGKETEAELLAEVLRTASRDEDRGMVPISYKAARAIALAPKFFPAGLPRDKIHDIMEELLPEARKNKTNLIKEVNVHAYIEKKTHIAVGKVNVVEGKKLLSLEDELKKRVVGQEEGIVAVARALRRARTGIRGGTRPMGSFLFLGPTGVGKTETAKALADIFFGSEKRMVRLDMSEYQDDGSVSRLIGSFESGKQGTLSSMIRDNPYSVVLLDEFEKSSPEVRRLFLQILDEGSFSDMSGKPVSLQNNIIIATSNAAAEKIFALVENGAKGVVGKISLEKHRDELVREIVDSGVMPPELLNRFDAVVFYRPLSELEIGSIARMMLGSLADRLKEKGIVFEITDATIRTVMKYGYDPKFGARPMRRAIADHIEDLVARRIIEGKIRAGDHVALTRLDLD
ncbi:MAG: hypothetical protein COV07_01425 [Candidatus Vogelbacteria bacterium CG10_big_fil_rev_8_21_14_0_10_45_14]|uniref:Clp R domain-containing protein n=1 Tax=Candidatus Vogelbacteria bacterium CG10_big_fil_rev_8_21_14_0_10_45_14 TaxID=1975042 RepID=A0A2H0RKG0_9BACT|nr:MAG: hypothetical protein COV07_01425 [Candidatus Vogelbacteria bacterium CG10_big_fil_rev_8_21_14_0_10_45_14]